MGVIQVEELSKFLGLSMGGSLFEGGAYSRGGGGLDRGNIVYDL